MTVYTRGAETALKLLTKFGRDATFRKQAVVGTYNPSTSKATLTPTDTAGKAALFDFSDSQPAHSFAGSTEIQAGDKRAFLSPSGITSDPVPGDLLLVGTETWSILNCKVLAPAGTVVIYELHLRK